MTSEPNLTELIKQIRQMMPSIIAHQLTEVQRMDGVLLSEMMKQGMNEQDLIEQGYKPIDEQSRLIWIKKNEL